MAHWRKKHCFYNIVLFLINSYKLMAFHRHPLPLLSQSTVVRANFVIKERQCLVVAAPFPSATRARRSKMSTLAAFLLPHKHFGPCGVELMKQRKFVVGLAEASMELLFGLGGNRWIVDGGRKTIGVSSLAVKHQQTVNSKN